MTPIASVSNLYNIVQRRDEPVLDHCSAAEIPCLPFFPLAIGAVRDSPIMVTIAGELGVTPTQLALAWLLGRSPVVLPIPGTGRITHLEENLAGCALSLSAEVLGRLDAVAIAHPWAPTLGR